MLSKRVTYIDTSIKHKIEKLYRHETSKGEEKQKCIDIYQQPQFQKQMIDESPALAAIVRLYDVALRVNEFQKQELSQC